MQSSSEFLFLIISGNKKGLNVLLVHANDHPVNVPGRENLSSVFHNTFFFFFFLTPPVHQQVKSTQRRYLK